MPDYGYNNGTQTEEPYELDEDTLQELMEIKNNPGLVIEHAYEMLERATNGKVRIPNPTTSFSYLLECSALHAATLHNAHDARYREQYPRLATRYEHLYNHMFDEDYIGRFATPGSAKFELYFKKEEILKELENTEPDNNGIQRIVIPRGSYITTQDYIFTLLYPIEIAKLSHGSLSVLYLTDVKDPVQNLQSNIIEWGYVGIEDREYLRIRPKLLNVKLTQLHETVVTNGFQQTWTINNRFVHCRVYHQINGKIVELNTTHSDLVYDPTKVTARLRYLENKLEVIIPPIYANAGLLGNEIYVEVYTTVGKAEEPLQEYKEDMFDYQWGKLEDDLSDRRYVTPLEQLTNPIIRARTMLTGGKNNETFEETRDRVINRAGYTKEAITPMQLELGLKSKGYDILKSRDTLTSRAYLASRALPTNVNDAFEAGAAAAMETIRTSISELAGHPHVRDNTRRLTITPEMLYKNVDGVIHPVNAIENIKLHRGKMTLDQYVTEVNNLQYMYSPFYYVMDPTKHIFSFRPYYMDSPEVENQVFIQNNRSTQLSVSTDEVVIIKFEEEVIGANGEKELIEGYKINLRTVMSEAYSKLPKENLFVQLLVKPFEDKNYAAINGVLLNLDKDQMAEDDKDADFWQFTIKTKWDITDKHNLVVHDFYQYLNEGRKFDIPLAGEILFVYGLKDQLLPGYDASNIDRLVNKQIIDSDDIYAISVDKIDYRFGWYLDAFWANGVAVQGDKKYQYYKEDIPRVYSRDIYDMDENGIYLVENNDLKVLHRAGDPVLDNKGQPVYLHRKGDVMLGPDNQPLLELDRNIEFLIDIMMVDGVYYFATDDVDAEYAKRIGETVKNWIKEDLDDISDRLLENTRLYFYPKRTMGDTSIIIDGGIEIKEPTRQSFSVTFYMDEARYNNIDIRNSLTAFTRNIINQELQNKTVTISDIVTKLKEAGGEDILAVHMDRFGAYDDRKYTMFTMKHDTDRFSVRRQLEIKSDKTLKITEAIEVNFVNHQLIPEIIDNYRY